MKRSICRFYGTRKGCFKGAECKFSHVNSTQARQSDTPRENGAYHVPQPEYQNLTQWLSRFDANLANAPSDRALDGWFIDALTIVEGNQVVSRQRVVRHLGTELGLRCIQQLAATAPDTSHPIACLLFVQNRLKPLLEILCHPQIAPSALLEDAVTNIHNTLYGSGGIRGVALFQTVCAGFGSLEVLSSDDVDLFSKTITTLDFIIEHAGAAKVNENLKSVAETMSNTLNAAEVPSSAALLKARHSMRHIESMLGLGLCLPQLGATSLDARIATFELTVEGPGALRGDGPRHDNDRVHIDEIEIMPTMGELQSLEAEYLPVHDPRKLHLNGLEGLVDRQFRLLREDTVGQLRDAIRITADQLRTSLGRGAKHNMNHKDGTRVTTYRNVRVEGLHLMDEAIGMELTFEHPAGLRNKAKSARRTWWENSKSLNRESLVCLVGSDGFAAFLVVTGDLAKTKQATEADLRSDSLYKDDDRAHVWVQHVEPFQFSLSRCLECLKASESQRLVLCEFPGILLPSFFHTLQALKSISRKLDTPFADVLAPMSTYGIINDLDSPPSYAQLNGFSFDLSALIDSKDVLRMTIGQPFDFTLLSKHSTLDTAQQTAVIHALSHRLALIQGPPGTGKSYCGVALIKALLANKARAGLGPLICVTYTNHALDQLLEHLVDDGVENIIRLGGSSKSAKLADVNLRRVARGMDSTQTERHERWKNHTDIEKLKSMIENQIKGLNTHISFADIRQYLARHNQRHSRQLQELVKKSADDEGFETVDHDKRSSIQRFFYPRHIGPATLGSQNRSLDDLQHADLANVSIEERRTLLRHWTDAVRNERARVVSTMVEDYENSRQTLRRCYAEGDLRCLMQANIIGLTTSGLARRVDLLRRIPSKVLICEEAGEVLEAHLLTALLPSIEHAVLIGDHEQLRPQIQNYELQASNPRGERFSLDVSLFERLIRPPHAHMPKLPYSTLEIQRRMHPSISELIRHTLYPGLQDYPSVEQYPRIVGLKKRRFWLDHRMPEAPKDDSRSHSNGFEVDVVSALVSHIIKQCQYRPDEIAVLTPYLGQLRALRDRMRNMFEIAIDDRDQVELDKQNIDAGPEKNQARDLARVSLGNSIRLATVDNFQGEEANVVIVSLVRSNEEKKCGFLRNTNRANVLLSRAKHGMYLVGDSSCYEPQPMWAKVLELLRANENIGKALELVCPRHPSDVLQVSTAEDFVRTAPEGGCGRPCVDRLGCGHRCPQRCHAQRLHESVFCHVLCNRPRESCDHLCNKECGADCGKCDVPVSDVHLPCGHISPTEPCFISQRPDMAVCQTFVRRVMPGCGHEISLSCWVEVDDTTKYSHRCGQELPCGHSCVKMCHECSQREDGQIVHIDHGKCTTICDKDYSLCGHRCSAKCHDDECKPCQAPCQTSCTHSHCAKVCSEPCAPCAEPCTAGCEHSGACDLPCAAPCDILPCAKRCSKQLDCGHRCISLCGEVCPSSRFCQVCCGDEIRQQYADWTEMLTFGELDLDETPCFVLGCGHILTVTSLDGIMSIADYYNVTKNGTVTSIKGKSVSFEATLHKCPECRRPIQNLQRYNRIWRRAILDTATLKFICWCNTRFVPLFQALDSAGKRLHEAGPPRNSGSAMRETDPSSAAITELHLAGSLNKILNALPGDSALWSRFHTLVRVRKKIRQYNRQASTDEQPFGKVYNLIRATRIKNKKNGLQDQQNPDQDILQYKQSVQASCLSMRADLIMLTDYFQQRQNARSLLLPPNDWRTRQITIDFRESYQDCQHLIAEATARSLSMQQVEAMAFFGRLVALERSNIPSNQRSDNAALADRLDEARALLDTADELCRTKPGSTRGMASEVDAVRTMLKDETFYQTVSDEEKRAVVAAMATEFRTRGHWYRCPNGHPYTIGECGGAMQRAVCPECGAAVGGFDHRMTEGNVAARDFEGVVEGMGGLRL